ncbi:MAG: pantoate--beta-alanine ligase, partial [Rhodothermia bacterium]
MQVVHKKSQIRELTRRARSGGSVLALVPTMGALHEGHLSLVRAAREVADHVTVAIFVNPTQFGAGEDLDHYPADLEGDLAQLESLSVDAVFAPEVDEMYPAGAATTVHVEGADAHLCGPFRPGHFEGVTTVVAK